MISWFWFFKARKNHLHSAEIFVLLNLCEILSGVRVDILHGSLSSLCLFVFYVCTI